MQGALRMKPAGICARYSLGRDRDKSSMIEAQTAMCWEDEEIDPIL
jgi:hypothetical protein